MARTFIDQVLSAAMREVRKEIVRVACDNEILLWSRERHFQVVSPSSDRDALRPTPSPTPKNYAMALPKTLSIQRWLPSRPQRRSVTNITHLWQIQRLRMRLPPQIEFDDSDDEVDEFSGIDLEDYVAWCMERHTTWRAIKILNRRSDGRLFERGDDAPHQAASTGGFSILRA
ncbi:hypothetical protein IFM46972_09997 [Aspergillus udagawae]|uniref:Uncharacterized protein n=1 Tax=Aspergillus udagawae TaxID=91492 RepID=A0A8H3S9Q9_9EURO|nr:hypothetical protein IFM46972_09997 [Aspergillus udagawae]